MGCGPLLTLLRRPLFGNPVAGVAALIRRRTSPPEADKGGRDL